MPMPPFVPPMLAKLVRSLPEGPQWEYELKLDGYRLQAIKHGHRVHLYSRRGNDFTKPFAPIAASVSKIDSHSLVLDGEAVAVDPQGKPPFKCCKTAQHSRAVGTWSITPSIYST